VHGPITTHSIPLAGVTNIIIFNYVRK
jgi:hypothetical protein